MIHRFDADLAESREFNGQWDDYYASIWGGEIECIEEVTDLAEQRHGIDRRVRLKSGQIITVDEKLRRRDYGDILLELWSQWYGPGDARNRRGWTVDWDKRCDYIAWCIAPLRTCRLLPYDQLRRTTRARARAWAEKQGDRWRKVAQNAKYETINIAIPWDVLYDALREDSVRPWG
jgi:hypothetical protein